MFYQKFNHVLSTRLAPEALKSKLPHKLSAGIIKNGKIIGHVHHNKYCTVIRNKRCSSVHAEAAAILNHYPDLRYSESKGWFLLRDKGQKKKCKKAKVSKLYEKG